MPKSKRAKVVHTSKVTKKGKDLTLRLYSTLQSTAASSPHILVFAVANMRNTYLKDVRAALAPHSRLFFGKTRVMAKALGDSPETEFLPGLAGLRRFLVGDVGLVCTQREDVAELLEYFERFSKVDFARAGTAAARTFTIPEGVVYSRGGEIPAEEDVPMPHSMEQTVRRWGMPTKLEKGKVMLDSEYVVCEEGKVLNSHQAALLKLFGVATAEFRVSVRAYWSRETGEVKEIDAMEE